MPPQHHNLNTRLPIHDYQSQKFLYWHTILPLWIHVHTFQIHLQHHHKTKQYFLSFSQWPHSCWNPKLHVWPSLVWNYFQQAPREAPCRLRIPSSQARPWFVHALMAPHHFLPCCWWIWHQIWSKITRRPPRVYASYSILNHHWLDCYQVMWFQDSM